MSNAVLDFVRSKDPELNNADDDALTLFLGDKDPGFLDDAQFADRYALVKEKRKVEGGTPIADFVDKAADYLTPFVYGMSARGAISTLAEDIGAAGQVAGATTEALAKVQQTGSFKAATTPLPEVEDKVVVQAARGIGELAPALGAMAAGVPAPVALGAGMGANEFSRSGDVTRSMQAGGIGMAFPAAGEIGSVGGELLAGRVAARLGLGEAATGASMTAGKVVGAQSMYTTLMVAGESEHFAELLRDDPEKARDELTKMMLVNLVFEVPRLPQLAKESLARDHVQAWFKSPDYREVLDTIKGKEENVRERPEIEGAPDFVAGRDVGETVEVAELPAPPETAPETSVIESAKAVLPRAAAAVEGVGKVTEPQKSHREREIDWAAENLPFGEIAEVSKVEDSSRTMSALGYAMPSVQRRLNIISGKEPFPSKAEFTKGVEDNYILDALQLSQKVTGELSTLGLDVSKAKLPILEDFPSGREYFNAWQTLEARLRNEGISIASSLVGTKQMEKPFTKQDFTKQAPETPAEATAKIQSDISDTAKTEGARSAKDIKSELVGRLEEAIANAPSEADVKQKFATKVSGERYESSPDAKEKITIEIPGDGTFTVWNTKENLEGLLKRAKRIATTSFDKNPPKLKVPQNARLKDPERERLQLDKDIQESQMHADDLKAFLGEYETLKKTRPLTANEARDAANREKELEATNERLRELQARKTTSEPQGAIATPGPALQPAAARVPALTPKSQRQIITDLSKGLKLPIRFGRLRTTKFAGYFLKVQNLIGSKKANDIPIVTHEVGHKLDSVFGFASDPSLRAELDALGDPSMPGSRSSWTPSKTLAYKRAEGVAEFVRHWLIDPPNAARLAPNMQRQFEAALNANKDFGDTMRQAQSDIQVWRNALPQARLRSHISVGENPNKTPYTLSQLTRDLVDDLHFLRLAVDDAKMAGSNLSPSQNPYLLARNLRGSYGMADSFISKGVAEFGSKAVQLGTSLEHALKPVAGRIPDFRDWIVAKRAQELHRQGRQTGLVDSDVQATATQFDNDAAFQTAFSKVKEWQDAVLQYAVDSGFVTPDGAAAMRQMNQDYVPLHRVFEIGAGESPAVEGSGTGRGLNVGTPGSLKRLKGSPRDIVDPLETMVRNAYAIITASEKYAVNRAVADLARKPDMGKWVEHIATPKESVKVGLEKLRDQLEAAGADLTNVPDDLMLQFFQNSKMAPFGENIIKVVRDGKPEFYRLKRELFETFHALDVEDSGTLIRMLSVPAQVLRAGVTVAPDFALANALRDAFTSAIVSRHGLLPFEAVVRGVGAMLRNPKLVAEWQSAGGKNSIEASYFDRDKLQKFLSERITKDLTPAERALIVVKSPLQALRWLTSLSEEATRIGEYQKAFSDLVRGGMPEGDARRLAAYESRDRQDFAKGGAKTKIPRRLAAFWNAGVQGNVRLAQAFKENLIPTTLKGIAFITIPKLIEQAVNWDDEDYWDRPQWERDLFFLIPAGKGSDGHTRFIRIPTPFEAGVIFGTLPGRILQTIREKDPEAAKTFPMLLTKQTIPNPTPQWALTIFEDFMVGKNGWDVYRQRPIVPRSLEQMPADMQWTEQTSLTARKLGEALGFSPMKIDHIINSTTGGLGRQTTHQIVDRAIGLATGTQRTAKGAVPGGRFVTTPAAVSSQAIEDFYQTLDRIKTAAAGEKKGRDNDLVEWQKQFSKAEKELADLRKEMREAVSDTEKNVIAEEILTIARETMKDFKAR